MPAQGRPMDVDVIALTGPFPCLSAPVRWVTTAGSVGKTATARSNGSSTSSRRSTKRRSSPQTVTPAAGATASPWVNSGSARGTSVSSPSVPLLQGQGNRPRASVIPPHPLTEFSETSEWRRSGMR